ncbi:MAG: hypothetical protein V1929_09120 [bacterium]
MPDEVDINAEPTTEAMPGAAPENAGIGEAPVVEPPDENKAALQQAQAELRRMQSELDALKAQAPGEKKEADDPPEDEAIGKVQKTLQGIQDRLTAQDQDAIRSRADLTLAAAMHETEAIVDQMNAKHPLTKQYAEVAETIKGTITSKVRDVIIRHPFNHGLTPEHVARMWSEEAAKQHRIATALLKPKEVQNQVETNAKLPPPTGGSTPTGSERKPATTPRDDEAWWREKKQEVKTAIRARVAKRQNA